MAKGITKRDQDYSKWYTDVIAAAELADYSPVKGCMVIRPNGYAIWENIQKFLDQMFKDSGHVNAYFPLFIPESFLKKEAEHVEGFSPETAVVTFAGGKKLEEPLIVRPTSETIIWAMYKKWIQSYRDLPILINQWANVVRWEMRTRLFLRTTEFLWQEGHTAHETYEQAEEETLKILEIYKTFAEKYMAIPVIAGVKTEKEKFAGADKTYCIEAMMQDYRALQGGTSHNLGQNFAKAFDVEFQNEAGQMEHVWATSWGVSTRLVGALIMTHSDDRGLVLPPKLASTKVVIVPIWKSDEDKQIIMEKIEIMTSGWKEKGISFHVDARENYRPGWKFNEWEKRGIPIRIEVGIRDIENGQVVVVRRDTGEKEFLIDSNLDEAILDRLDIMQHEMFQKASLWRDEHTFTVDDFQDFKKQINAGNGFYWIHWCGERGCEDRLQNETKATIRLIPMAGKEENGKCLICGNPSNQRVLAAKAY